MPLSKGCIQIYTGNGKGKTTAAFGLAMRAAGRGLKVFIIQFLKSSETGELISAQKLQPNLQVFRFEKPRNFFWLLNDDEKLEVKQEISLAFGFVRKSIETAACDVLILDEIMGALKNNLLSPEDLASALKQKPETMEIVLTGRDVPAIIAEQANLITEMKDIKHYFEQGIPARIGIEM